MSTRQIASSTLWQIGSQTAMAAMSIVMTKLVAIGLSRELAGYYNTAYGFLQIFGILADFGLYMVAVARVSKAQGEERTVILGNLITLRLIILGCSMSLALLIAWANPGWRASPLALSITVAAFVPSLTLAAGILRTVFQVHYRMQWIFLAEVSQRVLTLTLTAFIVLGGARASADPLILYALLFVGGLGALLLLIVIIIIAARIETIRPRIDLPILSSLLRSALPYGVAFLCTALYRQTDVSLIALLRPDFAWQNAAYGFTQRALDMGYLIPTFILNSTLPLLSARHARGEDTANLLGKTLLTIILLSASMGLTAFFWSRPLMELLTTTQYLSAAGVPGADTAMRWLSLSMGLNGLLLFAFYSLLTQHRWRPLVVVLGAGAALSLLLNVTLIPAYGFMGACLTSVIVHAMLVIILLPVSVASLPVRLDRAMPPRLFVFIFLLCAALLLLKPLAVGALATGLLLLLLGVFLGLVAWGLGILKWLVL